MDVATARLGRHFVPRDRLTEEHRRLEIDLVDFVVCFFGHVEQRLLTLDAYAIHQDVEMAAPREGHIDGVSDRSDRMRIHCDPRSREALRAHLIREGPPLPPI